MEKMKKVEERIKCPWCDQEMSPVKSIYKGQSAKTMRVVKCSLCGSFISSRLDGIPDDIRHSELLKGA